MVVLFNSVDPLVKREVLFIAVGTSIGLLLGQLAKIYYLKRLKVSLILRKSGKTWMGYLLTRMRWIQSELWTFF